jgi:hypothetical protein
MKDYFYLIPIALPGSASRPRGIHVVSNQAVCDLEGAAVRILQEEDVPIRTKSER